MAKRNPADEARQLDTALNLSTEIGAVRTELSSGPTPRVAPGDFLSKVAIEDEPYLPLPIDQPAPAAPLSADQQVQRSSLWEGYGLWDAVKDSYSSESMIFAVLAGAKDKGFELDPSYRLPALDSDEWKTLTDGIPEEYHDNFEKALSADHAQYLRSAITDEVDTDARLQEYAGTAGRFALGVVNPEMLLMATATGGASWLGKANSVRQVVTRAAVVGAAENVAVEGVIAANRETRDGEDMAYAAAAGLLLGGAFGRLSAHLDPPERELFVKKARAELAEANTQSDFGDGFGADTAGAARINPLTGERRLVDDESLNPVAEVPLTTFDGARIGPFRDNAAVIHSIPDSQLRNTVGPYTGDPAGSSDGRVVPTGADEEAARVRKASRSPHALAYNDNYKAWATTRNLGALASRGMEARRAFGEEVTLHRIGAVPSTDQAVIRQAAAEDKYYEWFRTEAKRVGVKGFEELDGPPGGTAYRPRMWDKARVSEYSRGTRFGAQVVESLIAKAFKTANADVADEIAEKVGKSIAIKLRTSHAGINDTIVGLKQADGEWLADVLRETNADEDTIAYVKRMFDMKKEPTTEGSVSHAKHRTVLDESTSVMATDRMDGRTRELPVWELLVNDAETLADTYGHRMSGAIGFARRANVFSKADHEKNLKQVLSHYEAEGKLDEGKRVTSAMDEVYKLAHGISLVNPNEHPGMTALRNTARGLRDVAFTIRMNMAWMAQLPDSSAILVGGQAKRLLRYMPELNSIFTRMGDGTLDHKFAAEIEKMTGLATEGHVNSAFSAFDDDITSASSKFAHGLRVMQRGTQHISLLPKVQNFNQRLFAMSYGTRLIDNALGKASDLNAQRLASAGLDEAMMKRIAEQVKAHGSISDAGSGVKIERLNTDDWADRDAADSFWSAVTREGKRAVQEEVYGEAPAWMNNWVGKVVGQFKRFGVVSHTKQMLYAAKHRDADTVQRFMYSYMMSGLAYSSQMYLYSLTKPEEERKEWREKYLSPGAIAWGAFSRAGMFSMTPALLQTALSFADVSLNDTRTSGLSGNLFTGIPAVDIAMRSYNFLRDSSVNITRGDRQFDQSDFKNARGLLPYQNAPLVKQTLDWFEQMLPEDDGDKDQNKIDLGFRD